MKRDPNHVLAATLILAATAALVAAGVILILRRQATSAATPPSISRATHGRNQTHYFNLGLEDWQLGPANYVVRISQHRPVAITGIQGFASAAPLPGANLKSGLIRQTLVSLTYPGARAPGNVLFTKLPSFKRKEYSIGPDLLALNIKQVNAQTIETPINVSFPTPVRLPSDTILVHFANATYKVGGTDTSAVQCLDVELHLLVKYTFA